MPLFKVKVTRKTIDSTYGNKISSIYKIHVSRKTSISVNGIWSDGAAEILVIGGVWVYRFHGES